MSSKVIVFSSKSGSGALAPKYRAFKPAVFIEYAKSEVLEKAQSDMGNVDCILVTGGHGDFRSGQPTSFNDADMTSAREWIGRLAGEAKAVVLDYCFSSAVAASFLKLLPDGGCVVCAHGTAEGWFGPFASSAPSEPSKTVGDVISTANQNLFELTKVFTSASILVNKAGSPILYTAAGGKDLESGLQIRRNMLSFDDTLHEIKQLDTYVEKCGVTIRIQTPTEIGHMIKESLTMTVM